MITAHSPKWADPSRTSIELMALFPWLKAEVPFSASLNDSEAYGVDLYNRAVAGDFGVIAPYVAPTPTPVVINTVSPRQVRMALTQFGLRSAVEAAVAAGDQNLKDWWEFSTQFDRNNAQVLAMAAALNVSSDQIDALWKLAATL